ncbi:NCAPD2 family protein [Megaselia abdita]
MEFQFVIPSIHSELLHSQGANYFVRHEYTDSEIPEQLKACKTALYRSDAFYIFDYFDTFFSVIQNSESLSATNLDRSFDLLYASFEKLTNQLLSFLDDSAGAQQEGGRSRNEFLNLVKMSVYLFVNVAKAIDQQCMQQRSLGNPTGKKNKKSNENTEDEFTNWNKKCFSFLCKIYNILQINIEKLWSPPVAEESFVNLICDICYRFMENAANKERKFGDTIFQILGIAIKRYNHAMTFPVKTMQIIRSIENVAPVIASGITILSEEFGINSIFGILINEIVDCIAEDAADGVLVKNISTFLIELCNVASKLLLPHLSTISEELLNCESHLLRNSCLQVIGDTIASELSSENLSEEMKEVRNEFLENLITHFLDVSAHVRVKVLQIWVHLKENNCIPLTYQSKVLMEGVNRLFDKTSTVRKAAIHLIKSFLENNPFAPKLPLEEMIEKYKTACDKMEELQKMVEEEKKKAEEVEADWLEVVPKLMPIIVELLSGVQVVDDTRDDNFDELVQKIVSHLTAEEYKQAVKLVKRADVAAGTTTEVTNELTPEEKTVYYMTLMKSYLMLSKGCKDSPDEDLVGATAEDNIAELIAHICENVLLQDEKSILPQIIPVVLEICKYPSIYRDFELQQTASLTLIRFMTVSSKFCEDNMAFLMNVLNLTVNAKIKCNIIIGLSDLTFRYPNIIEPWTTHFYNILHEKDDNVRLTAIKILSHLILHEMIRVKGQIADLALCIIDENDDIRDITKSFFREIANKANILYNVMPDIISRLSDTSLNIREEDYQIIMKYILSLIQKDRQVETLVEKLCARFKITKEERQWRDIAYCLSLLNYNEKTMKKLIDNISNFKDKVQIDEVYQYFKTIITNTNKLAKPELKAIVTEFETRLNKCLDVGDDTEMEGNTSVLSPSMEQSQPTTSKKAKPINKKPTKKPPTRGLRPELSSNSESEDDRNTRKGTRSQAKKKGSKVIQESESSSEDSTAPQRKKGRKIH